MSPDDSSDTKDVYCAQRTLADSLQGASTDVLVQGSWRVSPGIGGVAGQSRMDDPAIVGNETAKLRISLPKGSNYFKLFGTVHLQGGLYSVAVTPPPPVAQTVNTFNSSNRWIATNELFYYVMLDPEANYTVEVVGDVDPAKVLRLTSWVYCLYAR